MKLSSLSLASQVSLYNNVLLYRAEVKEFFSKLTSEDFNVVIGGSFCLVCKFPEFHDREISDIDLIVVGTPTAVKDIQSGLNMLRRLGSLPTDEGSSDEAIVFGHICTLKTEILFREVDYISFRKDGRLFENPENILKVKREWVAKHVNKHIEPRIKDVEDIKILEDLLELPF